MSRLNLVKCYHSAECNQILLMVTFKIDKVKTALLDDFTSIVPDRLL